MASLVSQLALPFLHKGAPACRHLAIVSKTKLDTNEPRAHAKRHLALGPDAPADDCHMPFTHTTVGVAWMVAIPHRGFSALPSCKGCSRANQGTNVYT